MTQLAPGQNVALPGAPSTIAVQVASSAAHVDLIALLLDDDDTADGDNGVVLFSNLTAADGNVVLDTATDVVTVNAGAISADVHKVLIVAQADGQPTVSSAGTITATVTADGAPAATAQFDAATTPVATLQLAELYRHGGGWKVRALGDGYAEGLAKLLTVHGVEVDDEPAPPTPAPAAAQAPAAPPPPPSPAASPAPTVNLTKPPLPASGSVSLVKGQGVSLVKATGEPLHQVTMGLGWSPARFAGNIDLDASCVLLSKKLKEMEAVSFSRKKSSNGAVKHSGDNLTGIGRGDDEKIRVDLDAIPADVHHLVFTVNSFRGQTFDKIKKAYCRLLEGKSKNQLVRYDLSDMEATTGLIVCALSRAPGGWHMTAIGKHGSGSTYHAMVPEIAAALRTLEGTS